MLSLVQKRGLKYGTRKATNYLLRDNKLCVNSRPLVRGRGLKRVYSVRV